MANDGLKAVGATLLGIIYVVWSLGGTALHVWTVVLAYNVKGFLAACVSFCLPIVSAIYWAIFFWLDMHTFWNTYTMVIAAFGIVSLLGMGLMALVDNE